MIKHLFCFGFSYSASHLIKKLKGQNVKISASIRSKDKLLPLNVTSYLLDSLYQNPTLLPKDITHILISIPPINGEDIIIKNLLTYIRPLSKLASEEEFVGDLGSRTGVYIKVHEDSRIESTHKLPSKVEFRKRYINDLPHLRWLGYLSSTGVYGDRPEEWVTEETPVNPIEQRSIDRLKIENEWQDLSQKLNLPLHIFRLSGIYGPGRSVIDQLITGTAKRIDKANHFFSRIHVEDIANILFASMNQPTPGEIYNLADDFPSSQREVVEWACTTLNLPYPELITIDNKELSEMTRSFYNSSRKVSNNKVKTSFKYNFKYPNYKEGLKSILTLV
jgi:RPE1 domain-containing protein